ncbi:hypothetical protein [Encephalitozoon cuniculi GB-M1]|uniref:DUF5094 domain-containing protein n=2 Tax=Encephalitozoon cuniculi TaxID=6035 RepID=Q8SVB9_ENCCU|nr:uncharacterized protein ECU06_0680 [Encephalitozoon cuniculi GB-M1]AGE95754.1 hypothetical protein ECU06_0680 [Encephalitozoon cuniculi]KMV65964.1 hypothetical protein M970_060630 [Encephalitozoon cuniculi EcunIII-L]UYI27660.1 DUF5094 domain-containing protein [Encephalitozoon cuniculi]CAD25428.1 hypothetical protein [Encephalitozoon cuniculi GB-M1]
MKTPRKRITFKTPRKGAKTPMRDGGASDAKENRVQREGDIEKQKSPDSASRYRQILVEMKMKEEDLIESYKRENEYLRSLKTDALLYKKLVGFDIVENNGCYEVTHEVVSNNITKSIKFVLMPEDSSYIYKLVESRNVDLPDFLSEEITFDECQIKTFFFKVMEAVITKKS